MKLAKNQKGFGAVEAFILIGVIVVALAAFLVVHARQAKHTPAHPSLQSTISEYTAIQAKARDSKDKTNIGALQSSLEAYFSNTNTYPTLKQLADTNWRAQNFSQTDPTIASSAAGVAIGQPGGYVYTVSPANCDGTKVLCDNYTLSYKLGDGTTYEKKSLN